MKNTILLASLLSFLFSSCKKECSSGDTMLFCPSINQRFVEYKNGDSAFLAMPNAFSPNGDGVNDVLLVYSHNFNFVQATIHDREQNGKIIFVYTPSAYRWDGRPENTVASTPVAEKVYDVKIDARTIFGTSIHLDYTVSILPNAVRGADYASYSISYEWKSENAQFPTQFDQNSYIFDANRFSSEQIINTSYKINNCK